MCVAKTLPDHEKCPTHKAYWLSCAQFEALLAESGRCCQLCGIGSAETPTRKLFIDHDGQHGKWAVRGLLCQLCNNRLGHDNPFRLEVGDYLRNAWFRRQLAQQGIVPTFPDEPPVGSVVRDGAGVRWTRERHGLWPWRSDRSYIHSRDWRGVYRDGGGAHRLQLLKYGNPIINAELHVEDAQSLAELLRRELDAGVRLELARLLLDD